MARVGQDTIGARQMLAVGNLAYSYFDLSAAARLPGSQSDRLPKSLKVLLENLMRYEDGDVVTVEDLEALASWPARRTADREVAYHPVRVLMPDSSGAALLVDLTAMRDATRRLGGDPQQINPQIPVDLVIDHSVRTEFAGTPEAFGQNLALEFRENRERYLFLRWAQQAYRNMRTLPPGSGIVHQVNLEFLSRPIWSETIDGTPWAFPDSLVGMDSHTPMINALGVFGWGVGGIEAGSAMLGEPISMQIPEVIGCRLVGQLRPGIMATDLVLTVTQRLRKLGVIGKIVEFFGPGVSALPLPDRATISNMAPEYGANMGFFPIDDETIRYLVTTGRDPSDIALAEAYAKAQGLWGDPADEPAFSDVLTLDLGEVEPSLAGPSRPQDRRPLSQVPASFTETFPTATRPADPEDLNRPRQHGDIVIAAIASCTNTSNPTGMIAAGLLARNAVAKGLKSKPWIKTSLSPGSRVVADYLGTSGLLKSLEKLGFYLAGYGCMSCGGGSGPLPPEVSEAIDRDQLAVAAVLSTNRNFEGRCHPQVRAAYLGSPPLIVASAIAGSVLIDLENEPLGLDTSGKPVFLRDIWPSPAELSAVAEKYVSAEVFRRNYAEMFEGDENWRALPRSNDPTFTWDPESTYLRPPPAFAEMSVERHELTDIEGARALLVLGDNITTDHINPAGIIPKASHAGEYLISLGVEPQHFNSYVSRRGNHDVMLRGHFANVRIRNEMVPGKEGGYTRHQPGGEQMRIYDATERYKAEGVPLVVIAGTEYGTGSSRDWAAKGTRILGIRAIIAESFERIHRSNLVGMGVLPLQFPPGVTRKTLGIDGTESYDLIGIEAGLTPGSEVLWRIHRADGTTVETRLRSRVDTRREAEWCRHGGVLNYVLAKILHQAGHA